MPVDISSPKIQPAIQNPSWLAQKLLERFNFRKSPPRLNTNYSLPPKKPPNGPKRQWKCNRFAKNPTAFVKPCAGKMRVSCDSWIKMGNIFTCAAFLPCLCVHLRSLWTASTTVFRGCELRANVCAPEAPDSGSRARQAPIPRIRLPLGVSAFPARTGAGSSVLASSHSETD